MLGSSGRSPARCGSTPTASWTMEQRSSRSWTPRAQAGWPWPHSGPRPRSICDALQAMGSGQSVAGDGCWGQRP
eukprot:11293154-Alexandrium_andersonii.AAC.1